MDNWSHRSDTMKCNTCMWFLQKGEGLLGRCRKHSPTLSGFPVVHTDDWCGDHKINEEVIPDKPKKANCPPVQTFHGQIPKLRPMTQKEMWAKQLYC